MPLQTVLMRLICRAESISEFDMSYTGDKGEFDMSYTGDKGEFDMSHRRYW